MFIKVSKVKEQVNKTKRLLINFNPLLLILIFTLIISWCFFKISFLLSIFLLLITFVFLFLYYRNYPWLTLFLLIPILSLLIQNYLFRDLTFSGQIFENETLTVIAKTKTYTILQWHHQKFYWASYNENFIVGQVLKINAAIVDFNFNNNSFNFDFAKYLKNQDVYKTLKNVTFELLESKNLKFLFFNWMQKFSPLIQFFIFQQQSIPEIKEILNDLSLGYLLNFSGLNFFVFLFCFNKIWRKFSISNYFKIPLHSFLLFYLYLLNFPLIFSRIVLGLIVKNFSSIAKIKLSYLNKNVTTLNCLFLIHPKFIFEQMIWYLIVGYIFFQKPNNSKDIHFWLINLLKTMLIFAPLVIFFQFRWNVTAPILSLIIAPLISGFYLISFLFWWIPQLTTFWLFLEGTLLEMLKLSKRISFNWNFGTVSLILFLIYYILLFCLLNKKKNSWWLIMSFFIMTFFIVFYSKIILPQETFYMLNVGNGNSFVYINKFKNLVIVYDCGSGLGFSSTMMSDFLKSKGINHVDLLFISHWHQDHYNGLESLKKTVPIYKIIDNNANDLLWKIKGLEIIGWKLEKMTDLNDTSLIILIKTQTQNILLVGDLTMVGEQKLLEDSSFVKTIKELTIHLMQLGHHGSKTSSSKEFLTLINPQNIFISAGNKNGHIFPDKEVINLLKILKINYFSTSGNKNWKFNLKTKTLNSFS